MPTISQSMKKKILEAQLLTYHSHLLRQEEVPNSIQDAIKTDVMKLVPLVRRLMQITLTLPVTSNEAERSFSGMRRVFSYLRSTMTTERLSNLCRMVAHPDRVENSKTEDILTKFVVGNRRKLEYECFSTDRKCLNLCFFHYAVFSWERERGFIKYFLDIFTISSATYYDIALIL